MGLAVDVVNGAYNENKTLEPRSHIELTRKGTLLTLGEAGLDGRLSGVGSSRTAAGRSHTSSHSRSGSLCGGSQGEDADSDEGGEAHPF